MPTRSAARARRGHRLGRHVRSQAVAYTALFVALGGTSYAAVSVSGADVRDGSLTAADIQQGSLTGDVMQRGSIPASALDPAAAQRLAAKTTRGPRGKTGPRGKKGDKGATGPTGPQGPAGPHGTPLNDIIPVWLGSSQPVSADGVYGWSTTAHEPADGYAGYWKLSVWAICARVE